MKNILHLVPITLLLAACAANNPDASILEPVTEDEDIATVRQAYTETIGELSLSGGLASDAALAERVRQIAGRIVPVAINEWPDTEDWEWSITLIDDPEASLPSDSDGGYMFMYTGAIEPISLTDDELAFLISLYIIDSATHFTDAYVNFEAFRWLGVIALNVALGPAGGFVTGTVYENQMIREYTRSVLLEMDEVGARFTRDAGYDPEAAVTFLEKSVSWFQSDEADRDLADDLNWFFVGDYVTEERYDNFKQLLADLSESTPEPPPAPHPVRIIYDSAE